MTMLSVIPQEFFDGVPVPPAVKLDGDCAALWTRCRRGRGWPVARDAQRRHARLARRARSALLPFDRTWHRGKAKGEVKVRVDEEGQVYLTTASGQSRTVTPYDYRMTDEPAADTKQDTNQQAE